VAAQQRRVLGQVLMGQFRGQEVPQVLHSDGLPHGRQAPGREVPQDDPHGQQRAVQPGLGVVLVVAVVVRQGRSQGLQVGLGVAQPFPGQAQGHEVDEGALARARVAQQHQMGVVVEFLQRGATAAPLPRMRVHVSHHVPLEIHEIQAT